MHGFVVLFRRVEVEEGLPAFLIWAHSFHANIYMDTFVMIPRA